MISDWLISKESEEENSLTHMSSSSVLFSPKVQISADMYTRTVNVALRDSFENIQSTASDEKLSTSTNEKLHFQINKRLAGNKPQFQDEADLDQMLSAEVVLCDATCCRPTRLALHARRDQSPPGSVSANVVECNLVPSRLRPVA